MADLKAAVPSDVDDVAGSVFTASRPRYFFSWTEAIDLREIPDLFFFTSSIPPELGHFTSGLWPFRWAY